MRRNQRRCSWDSKEVEVIGDRSLGLCEDEVDGGDVADLRGRNGWMLIGWGRWAEAFPADE